MSTAPVGKKLAKPPPAYDWRDQHDTRSAIEDELARCVKRNEELQPARLMFADTVDGARYRLTVANGDLTLTDEAGAAQSFYAMSGPTSYTPALSFATPGDSAFTYTTQNGQYYRIGDLVFVVVDIVFTVTHTTASGALQIALPLACSASAPRTPFTVQSLAGLVLGAGLISTNGSAGAGASVVTLNKLDQAAGTGTNILVAQVPTGAGNKTVRLSGWYRAA